MKKLVFLALGFINVFFLQAQLTMIPSPTGYQDANKGYNTLTPFVSASNGLVLGYTKNTGASEIAYYNTFSGLTIVASPTGFENSSKGYNGYAIEYLNEIFMKYDGNDNNADLGKLAWSSLSIINSPTGYDGGSAGRGYFPSPILAGGYLYLKYFGNDSNFDLAKFNGSSLTIIPSPAGYENSGYGCTGNSTTYMVMGSDLFVQYAKNNGNYVIGKYDGSTLTFISNPVGYENLSCGYIGNTISYGGSSYMQFKGNDGNYDLAKFDGTTLTIIPSPAGYENSAKGYLGVSFVSGGNLYLQYEGNDGNFDLAKYDGTTLTIIPSPAGYENAGKGYKEDAYPRKSITDGVNLYMQYEGNDGNFDLAKYDGTTLTIISSPTGYENSTKGFLGATVLLGSDLYTRFYGNDGNYDLAKYDGTNLSLIASPSGYENSSRGYYGAPIVMSGKLFLQYFGNDNNFDLFQFDGLSFTTIPSPTGYENANSGYQGSPVLYNNSIYLQYRGNDGNYDLAKYSICDAPSLPTISATDTVICSGQSIQLNVASGSLNNAAYWRWFGTSCGSGSLGSGNSLTVSPTATKTYYIRGEGGCITPGACTSFTVTVNSKPSVSITGASSICVGSTTTLSPTTGGTWVSSNSSVATVTNAGEVTGLSAGSATFNFTQTSTGCSSDATAAVTVNTNALTPTIGTITQPTCVLSTGSVILNNLPSSGTWTLTQNPGGTTYSGSGTTYTLTGLPANSTYTFTVTNSNGCISSATANVVINAVPSTPAVGGDSSVCVGSTANITPNTGGTWASSNTAVASITNAGVVTGVNGGPVTLTFTLTATGCTNTTSFTVNSISTNTLNETACDSFSLNGQNYTSSGTYTQTFTAVSGCDSVITLYLTVLNNVQSSQTITICSGDSISIDTNIYNTTGTYVNYFTASNGCDSILTTNLTVLDSIDITTTVNNSSITANQSGANYQWINCNGNIIINGDTSQTFLANTNGSYAVIITLNSCSDTSACETIVLTNNHSSVIDLGIVLYPNPSSGLFSIQNVVAGQKLALFNQLGQVLHQEILNTDQKDLDLRYLPKGIYFIQISDEYGSFQEKVILE